MTYEEATLIIGNIPDPRVCKYEDEGRYVHLIGEKSCTMCGRSVEQIEKLTKLYETAEQTINLKEHE